MKLKHNITHNVTLDGITYRVAKPEDFDAVIDYTYTFYLQDEPMSKAGGGQPQRQDVIVAHLKEFLSDGVSVIAVDAEKGNIVGHMIASTYNREVLCHPRQSLADLKAQFNHSYASVLYATEEVIGPNIVYGRHPEDNKVLDFYGVSIDPSYRRRGIAKRLVKHSLEVAVMAGCDSGTAICSSPFSKKIFIDFGFELWTDVTWSDFLVDGKVLYDRIDFPVATTCYKKLRTMPLKGHA